MKEPAKWPKSWAVFAKKMDGLRKDVVRVKYKTKQPKETKGMVITKVVDHRTGK